MRRKIFLLSIIPLIFGLASCDVQYQGTKTVQGNTTETEITKEKRPSYESTTYEIEETTLVPIEPYTYTTDYIDDSYEAIVNRAISKIDTFSDVAKSTLFNAVLSNFDNTPIISNFQWEEASDSCTDIRYITKDEREVYFSFFNNGLSIDINTGIPMSLYGQFLSEIGYGEFVKFYDNYHYGTGEIKNITKIKICDNNMFVTFYQNSDTVCLTPENVYLVDTEAARYIEADLEQRGLYIPQGLDLQEKFVIGWEISDGRICIYYLGGAGATYVYNKPLSSNSLCEKIRDFFDVHYLDNNWFQNNLPSYSYSFTYDVSYGTDYLVLKCYDYNFEEEEFKIKAEIFPDPYEYYYEKARVLSTQYCNLNKDKFITYLTEYDSHIRESLILEIREVEEDNSVYLVCGYNNVTTSILISRSYTDSETAYNMAKERAEAVGYTLTYDEFMKPYKYGVEFYCVRDVYLGTETRHPVTGTLCGYASLDHSLSGEITMFFGPCIPESDIADRIFEVGGNPNGQTIFEKAVPTEYKDKVFLITAEGNSYQFYVMDGAFYKIYNY